MKLSHLFSKTLRETALDETSKNAQLLIRAGYISKTMAGVYSFLPLGLRVLNKIEHIVRKHLTRIGAQELLMNSLHPQEWWRQTGRDKTVDVLFTLESQTGSTYMLAPTHEEQVTPTVGNYINSWKDLPVYSSGSNIFPLSVFQIQTKFRDELRSKAGLMRGREFRMKDLYDFHRTQESQDAYYNLIMDTYLQIYKEIGLDAHVVQAGGGAFAKFSHEFQVLCDAGEDWTVVWSDGVKDNLEIATGYPSDTHTESLGQKLYRENLIDDVKNVSQHAQSAGVDDSRILKSVLFITEEDTPRYIAVVIRGDLEINQDVLSLHLNCALHQASGYDLERVGTVRGRFTPIIDIAENYKQNIYWIFDKSIEQARGMASSYYTQVDVDRDCVTPYEVLCVSIVKKGFHKDGNSSVTVTSIQRSSEVGNIFKLGNKWTKAFDIKYTDENNTFQYPIMGCHGIGTSRCMGVLAEICSDEAGLIWPRSVAPYEYHIITHTHDKDDEKVNKEILEKARDIYTSKFDECIWDDREDVSIGQKLKDADLIGCPRQIIITKRSLENGGLEIKQRDTGKIVIQTHLE